jgi:hypothetical protein
MPSGDRISSPREHREGSERGAWHKADMSIRLPSVASGFITAPSSEEWQPARLIPVIGIRGQQEQEKRATSVLLAVMCSVPEFGHTLLRGLGAPKGHISTYTEVRLKGTDGKVHIPDGAIVVERGKKCWRALVEVKTGRATLEAEQVTRYLEMARDHGFNAVLTISNQLASQPTDVPVVVDKRKLRSVGLYHRSWWRIITEAVMEYRFRGVSDPDQAWILGELIAYLDHEESGASGFEGMGDHWVNARDAARQGTLRAADEAARSVAESWEQFLDYLALGLSQDLGRDVQPVRPRKQDNHARLDKSIRGLAESGCLEGAVRVPDAVAPLVFVADLRARQLTTSVVLDAPREGRPASRIGWIVRQLESAPIDLRITTSFCNVHETTSLLLGDIRENPRGLLSPIDPKREPRCFELALARPLGLKNGKGRGSFVRETRRQVIDFYREVIQNLKAWQARPPKLPDLATETSEIPQSGPPPFAAVEGRDIGEATTASESKRTEEPEA